MLRLALWAWIAVLASSPATLSDSVARPISVRPTSTVVFGTSIETPYGYGFWFPLWEHLPYTDAWSLDDVQFKHDRLAQPVPARRRIGS